MGKVTPETALTGWHMAMPAAARGIDMRSGLSGKQFPPVIRRPRGLLYGDSGGFRDVLGFVHTQRCGTSPAAVRHSGAPTRPSSPQHAARLPTSQGLRPRAQTVHETFSPRPRRSSSTLATDVPEVVSRRRSLSALAALTMALTTATGDCKASGFMETATHGASGVEWRRTASMHSSISADFPAPGLPGRPSCLRLSFLR